MLSARSSPTETWPVAVSPALLPRNYLQGRLSGWCRGGWCGRRRGGACARGGAGGSGRDRVGRGVFSCRFAGTAPARPAEELTLTGNVGVEGAFAERMEDSCSNGSLRPRRHLWFINRTERSGEGRYPRAARQRSCSSNWGWAGRFLTAGWGDRLPPSLLRAGGMGIKLRGKCSDRSCKAEGWSLTQEVLLGASGRSSPFLTPHNPHALPLPLSQSPRSHLGCTELC